MTARRAEIVILVAWLIAMFYESGELRAKQKWVFESGEKRLQVIELYTSEG